MNLLLESQFKQFIAEVQLKQPKEQFSHAGVGITVFKN
jgi:hypothetical protein